MVCEQWASGIYNNHLNCGQTPSKEMTGGPGYATHGGAAGEISSRAALFPWLEKGGGIRLNPQIKKSERLETKHI